MDSSNQPTPLRIHNIAVEGKDGIKGATFAFDLTGCDIFAGANGTRKTSRLLAVRGLLSGFAWAATDLSRPYQGELPRAVVKGTLTDGTVLSRDLSLTSRARGWVASQEQVDAHLGKALVSFDLRDFEAGTDRSRAEIVAGVVRAAGSQGWTAATCTTWLEARLKLQLKEPENGAREDEGSLRVSPAHPAHSVMPVGADVADWIEASMTALAGTYTTANKAAKDAAAVAAAALAALNAHVLPDGDRTTTEAELAAAKEKVRAADAVAVRADVVRKLKVEHARRGAKAEQDLLEAQRREGVRARVLNETREIHRSQVDLEASWDRAAEPSQVAAALDAELKREESALDEANKRYLVACQECDAAADARVAAEKVANEALAVANTIAAFRSGGTGCCETCGAEDPLVLGSRLEDAEKAIVACNRAAKTATAKAKEAREGVLALEQEIEGLKGKVQAATVAIKANVDQVQARAAKIANLQAAVTTAEGALADAETFVATAQAALDAHNAEEAPKDEGEPQSEEERAALTAEVARLEAVIGLFDERVRLDKASEEATKKKAAAETFFTEVQAVQAALHALRERVTADTFAPICEAAGEVLAGSGLALSLRSASDYGAVLQAGAWPDVEADTYVHFAALSGAQKAIFAAALSVAFARLSGAAWRGVMLDNLESIEPARLDCFLSAVAGLVERGELSNFVGAYQTPAPSSLHLPAGVRLVALAAA